MEPYNPAMGLLLFVALLVSAAMVMVAFAFSIKGNERLAWRIAKAWAVGAAICASAAAPITGPGTPGARH